MNPLVLTAFFRMREVTLAAFAVSINESMRGVELAAPLACVKNHDAAE